MSRPASQKRFSFNTRREHLGKAFIGGSYAYRVNLPAGVATPVGALRHLALIADDFTARLGAPLGNGHYTHRDGYNVAFTDGSVSWYADEKDGHTRLSPARFAEVSSCPGRDRREETPALIVVIGW